MAEPARAEPVERIAWRRGDAVDALQREWLVTNGLGGFASATIGGELTRRYHGMLIAGLAAPLGRMVMLSRVGDEVIGPEGETTELSATTGQAAGSPAAAPTALSEFRLEQGLPVWTYQVGPHLIEKRVLMPHGQNTVHIGYRVLEGPGTVRLRLRPSLLVRRLEDEVAMPANLDDAIVVIGDRCEIRTGAELPTLRLQLAGRGGWADVAGQHLWEQFYAAEAARGYDAHGRLWSPGTLIAVLDTAAPATLVASTEGWDTALAIHPVDAAAAERRRRQRLLSMAPEPARTGTLAELVFAADQFLVVPAARAREGIRARAEDEEIRSLIAGYHWFSDWGRDTMISLEGLALFTGRRREASAILRTFAEHLRRGLIPNLFPDGSTEGMYHTADASLWFIHAFHRYVEATGDRRSLRRMLPALRELIDWHVRGTDFNIGVDPADGLLRQGADGYQLTWMDAKVGDWVVTPRRGKAVELQGLWFNALCLLASWVGDEAGDGEAREYRERADTVRDSFNRRFWNPESGCLFDVVDVEQGGDDASIRPNQLLAFSLDHPVLDRARWQPVLDVVTSRLLTPVGLRSLAPGSPDYQPRYDGDIRARDAAYHQGTVWGWLIGPYVDAFLRVHGDTADIRPLLAGLLAQLDQACVGQLSEVFDAEQPFAPRGCVAQAWTVAETLRCLLRAEMLDARERAAAAEDA